MGRRRRSASAAFQPEQKLFGQGIAGLAQGGHRLLDRATGHVLLDDEGAAGQQLATAAPQQGRLQADDRPRPAVPVLDLERLELAGHLQGGGRRQVVADHRPEAASLTPPLHQPAARRPTARGLPSRYSIWNALTPPVIPRAAGAGRSSLITARKRPLSRPRSTSRSRSSTGARSVQRTPW